MSLSRDDAENSFSEKDAEELLALYSLPLSTPQKLLEGLPKTLEIPLGDIKKIAELHAGPAEGFDVQTTICIIRRSSFIYSKDNHPSKTYFEKYFAEKLEPLGITQSSLKEWTPMIFGEGLKPESTRLIARELELTSDNKLQLKDTANIGKMWDCILPVLRKGGLFLNFLRVNRDRNSGICADPLVYILSEQMKSIKQFKWMLLFFQLGSLKTVGFTLGKIQSAFPTLFSIAKLNPYWRKKLFGFFAKQGFLSVEEVEYFSSIFPYVCSIAETACYMTIKEECLKSFKEAISKNKPKRADKDFEGLFQIANVAQAASLELSKKENWVLQTIQESPVYFLNSTIVFDLIKLLVPISPIHAARIFYKLAKNFVEMQGLESHWASMFENNPQFDFLSFYPQFNEAIRILHPLLSKIYQTRYSSEDQVACRFVAEYAKKLMDREDLLVDRVDLLENFSEAQKVTDSSLPQTSGKDPGVEGKYEHEMRIRAAMAFSMQGKGLVQSNPEGEGEVSTDRKDGDERHRIKMQLEVRKDPLKPKAP